LPKRKHGSLKNYGKFMIKLFGGKMKNFRHSILGERADEFYVSQIEPREETENKINLFKSDYEKYKNLPEYNWCGICSLAMILNGLNISHSSVEEMYQEAFDFGVYELVGDKVIGAYHKKFAQYIQEKFNLESSTVRNVNFRKIKKIILNGNFFIASVTPDIRYFPKKSAERSGHLILVFGISEEDAVQKIIFHNSTGFSSTNSQCSVEMPFKLFKNYFSGNGIIVKKP